MLISLLLVTLASHTLLNLWKLKDVLDSKHNHAVTEVLTTWMQGHVPESSLRRALTESGEMDRWDTVRLQAPEQRRLADATDAVTELLNSTPPGNPMAHLARADGLLRQVADLFREARKAPDQR